MGVLGQISCLTSVKNTGIQPCFCDPKLIQGAIIVPKATVLSTVSLAAFQTALTNLLYNASKAARGYPVYDFETPKDATEKKTVQTMSTGQKHVVREGFNDWSFQFVQGGLNLLQACRTFNGSNWDFFFIDNDPLGQKILGITGGSANQLQAVPSGGGFNWAEPWVMNDGSKITEYMLQFVFKSSYVNDVVNYVQMPSTFDFPTSYPGLVDVNLQANSVASVVAKHFYVNLVSPLGQDIGALNAAALGGGVGSAGLWNGAAAATPTLPYTITSSTWVPSTVSGTPGYFDILVGVTNYATPPAASLINLAAPSVLVAAGVDLESTGQLSIPSV